MARHRKRSDLAFDALTIEGALISPAMMARIAVRDAGEQKETDYGAPKGLTLRDEIAYRFRIGQGLFEELNAAAHPSHAATERFARELLTTVFRFDEVAPTDHAGLHLGAGGRVPLVVATPADDLDKPSAVLSAEGRRRSAASTLQDYLNAEDAALWGLACNGERLRLMRDNASLTRPAYIEADLRRLFEAEAFADFTALWLVVHASRFGKPGAAVTDCALERWREAGQKAGVAARERLRDGFEAALLALGTGFLAEPSNDALRQKIESHTLSLPDYFGQLLRLVYRLIFLFAAEDRGLLHPPGASTESRKLYAEGYSASALREASARRSAWDRHYDRWEGLRITFKALMSGEPKLGLPALDGLFARGSLPDLETARLSNRALMEAIWRLAWIKDGERPVPVNWRDMETEELGSVYEGLLELTPRLSADGRAMSFAEGAETKGNARKTSGSYYTPDSLVQLLLDSALDPVLDRVEAEAQDRAEALLKVTVIDPACGSGHFLLAGARRIATRVAKARAGGLASAEDYRHALRDVVRACIHGVDRNPMAVELAKVALWIETVDPGKPLGFLDANFRCGDALFGVFDLKVLDRGIPDGAYKPPLSGDDKDAARIAGKVNSQQKEQAKQGDLLARLSAETLARETRRVLALPEDDVGAVQHKAEAWRRLRAEAGWGARKLACDLYVAAFLRKKALRTDGLARAQTPDRVPTTLDVRTALSGGQPDPQTAAMAVDLAEEARAFHWPLEFPVEVAAGGFDVVLGNPPWERIKLQEQEFFAAHAPEIAEAPNAAVRGRLIAALAAAEPGSRERALSELFEQAKRTAEASSVFARVPGEEGGRFPLTGRGDVNTYALFAELFSNLASPRGRSGVIVPTGIATDATTAPFFAALTESKRLASLFDFENSAPIFPAVHRSFKFSLLTVGRDVDEAEFAFFLFAPAQLNEAERHFTLSPAAIARINPNTKTAPVFRSRKDAELTAKIYDRVPVLIDESTETTINPWQMSFHTRIWHMAEDSGLFRTADQLDGSNLIRFDRPDLAADEIKESRNWTPLYEAKMIHLYDHRWATYDGLKSVDVSAEQKADRNWEATARYWVPSSEVEQRLKDQSWERAWLLGWRDICRATDERTLISCVFPRGASGDTLLLMFPHAASKKLTSALLANLSALVADYAARQKVGGTHLKTNVFRQLPVLPPSAYTDADLTFIAPRVLELTYTSWSLQPFARDLGHDGPPFAWNEERRAVLRAELDAWYARAYRLTRDDLRYILDPADVMGPDYPSETFRVLKEKEERRFGEYRTRRLVLAAWDAQEAAQHIPLEISAPSPLVHPSGRSAGDWARPAATPVDLRLQTQAQIAAVLKSLRGPAPARQVRLAALYALEPHLLTARLDDRERAQWVRAVGGEANPPAPGVVSFGLGGATGWGEALQQLRAAGALVDDPSADTWAPGSGLSQYFTEGWPERAGFALEVARRVLADQALTSDELNGVAALAA